jgi:hypothetical protein
MFFWERLLLQNPTQETIQTLVTINIFNFENQDVGFSRPIFLNRSQ